MENIQTITGTAIDRITEHDQVHMTPETEKNIGLTSSELANLWAAYMDSSMKSQEVRYFLEKVEDTEIRPVLEYSFHLAGIHLHSLKKIFINEKHPVPHGFTDEDVNPDAPRLFSDPFILSYLEEMAKIRIDGYSIALQMSARRDIREYFTQFLASAAELYNRVVSVQLSMGIYNRAPSIPVPEKVDYVKKQNFLTGYFGDRRPLTSIEISHIFSMIKRNSFRKALFNGFARVAGSQQMRKYMTRGRDISSKQVNVLSSILLENDLPVTMHWDPGVLDAHLSPFSDKMMAQIVRVSNVVWVASYGKSLPVLATRRDLAVNFTRLMAEAAKYAGDGENIIIDNGWAEEPPMSKSREVMTEKLH